MIPSSSSRSSDRVSFCRRLLGVRGFSSLSSAPVLVLRLCPSDAGLDELLGGVFLGREGGTVFVDCSAGFLIGRSGDGFGDETFDELVLPPKAASPVDCKALDKSDLKPPLDGVLTSGGFDTDADGDGTETGAEAWLLNAACAGAGTGVEPRGFGGSVATGPGLAGRGGGVDLVADVALSD